MYIYRGGYRGNTGQLDEDLIVKDIGQLIERGDISLVSRKGGVDCLARDLASLRPPPIRHSRPIIRRLL